MISSINYQNDHWIDSSRDFICSQHNKRTFCRHWNCHIAGKSVAKIAKTLETNVMARDGQQIKTYGEITRTSVWNLPSRQWVTNVYNSSSNGAIPSPAFTKHISSHKDANKYEMWGSWHMYMNVYIQIRKIKQSREEI